MEGHEDRYIGDQPEIRQVSSIYPAPGSSSLPPTAVMEVDARIVELVDELHRALVGDYHIAAAYDMERRCGRFGIVGREELSQWILHGAGYRYEFRWKRTGVARFSLAGY